MNAITKSPVEDFAENVLPPDRMESLARSLPAHIRPDVFQRNLLNALMANVDLMRQPPGLVFREVSKAAGLGLLLDPQLGEAYIILGYNYKTKTSEPQLRVGYKGLVKLARQSGVVAQTYAHEVCANDEIVCQLGVDKLLVHKPKLFSDRGAIIGYYAVIKFKDGEFDFEPMSVDDVHRIRDRGDAWKAFKDGKIKSTPWSTDETEMAKKTVIRRLMKRAPQSPEMADALRIEDAADYGDRIAAPTPPRRVPPPPPSATPAPMIEHQATPAAQNARRPPPPPAALDPAPKADPEPKSFDTDDVRQRYIEAAKTAADPDALEAAWQEIVEPVYDQMFPPDADALLQTHRHNVARLEP